MSIKLCKDFSLPELNKGVILETLPGVIAGFMKKKYGRGPENQKIYFNDNDVIVYIYGFLNKQVFWDDTDVSETVRKYYYRLMKKDIDGIRQLFIKTYNIHIQRVFCDFDIAANEGVFIFKSS